QSFHQLAYGRRMEDPSLSELVRLPATQVTRGDAQPPPRPRPYPAPAADQRLLPRTVTATTHQQLIDCPYQFFAARCLGLAPPEPVTELLSKSDYGERIHRILQAFHAPVRGLPGPFSQPLTEQNREQAVAMLQEISTAVFARDLEDNFLHRGWLRRWEALIGEYVDWQIRRAGDWHVQAVEVNAVEEHFTALFEIKGRLDRIDAGRHGSAIVDYKTGEVPGKEDIQSGEAVQLPFYALLMDTPVTRVEYLCLDKNRFGTRAHLEGENLRELRDQTARRLKAMMKQLHQGTPLPAWGDEQTCSRCKMEGLCRKQAWQSLPQ
ncbi:MAG TPA: PD-(D/E)XK nuclease family protein, partial [Gammaproteobacteria bacterium]|nr:PD-(D/E)XK nuclease family protein [Gammaproteobacteria bacterium]